ncbi:5570_t:CDS:1, partial [Gigaspora rosea]
MVTDQNEIARRKIQYVCRQVKNGNFKKKCFRYRRMLALIDLNQTDLI